MPVIDLEVRLMNYIRRNIFSKNWVLDGETPRDAFLGKGTYGKVYAVVCDTVIGGRVTRQFGALKLIPVDETIFDTPAAQALSDEEKQRRLSRELRKDEQEIGIMEKVRSTTEIAYFLGSAIIERRDTRLKSWDVLILMDRHQSMAKYLKEHQLAPGSPDFLPVVLRIWRDISKALVHCQNCSILHNDVKPANLLYSPAKESFVLSDFGEALPQQTYEPNRAFRGTLDYMSPEMYQKLGGDSRMDMYSLAMTIYELLNGGRLPLEDSVGRSQAWKVRIGSKKALPPIKGVPDDVNAALLRCLEYDPNKRFATCKDLESEVLRLYVKYTSSAPVPTNNRKYMFIGVGAVAVLVLGVVLVMFLIPPGPDPKPDDETPTAMIIEETTPPPTPTATPTVSPTPTASPVPLPSLRMGQLDTPIEREGENVTIRGSFYIEGEFEPEQLTLLVNGEEWGMELGEARGEEHSFVSRGTLGEDVQRVSVQLALDADGERVMTKTSSLPVMLPEVTQQGPTETPKPEPTPEPKLGLRLEEQVLMAGTGNVEIHGEVSVEGELTQDELRLWVNNNYISDVQWEPMDGGYRFEASVMMDLEGMERLSVRVTMDGNEAVEAAGELPVVTPSPEPTRELAALELDAQDELEGRPVSGSGTLTLSGRAEPGEALSCSVNGQLASSNSVVDADGTFVLELSARLLADGENSVQLSYYGAPDASPTLEFTLLCDRQGPEIESVDSIDQFTAELYVTVNDPAQPCGVALNVDGETVMESEANFNGEVVFQGIDGLGLSADSQIELLATDALGNSSSRTITFARSLTSINVTNRARLETTIIGQTGANVDISALPGAVLYLKLNDAAGITLSADGDGRASFALNAAELVQGENLLRIGYDEVDGAKVAEEDAQSIELKLNYDGEAPQVSFSPTELVLGENSLTLTVSNEERYRAEVYVDGTWVAGGSFSGTGEHTLNIPNGVTLDGESSVELLVTDEAGNESRSSVPVLFIAPISVENAAELQEGVKGTNDAASLRLSGAPGAQLELSCGEQQDTLTLGDDGTLTYDLWTLLMDGQNDISIAYAASNGFPERALAGTAAQLSINCDGTAPKLTVEAENSAEQGIITRDTTQLTARVSNEPDGFELALYVDGEPVWSETVRDAQECVVPNINGLGLTQESEIWLEARDMANNSAVQIFRYTPTTTRKDADAGLWKDNEPAYIGSTTDMAAWVLSNGSDMENARMVLVDANGAERDCVFDSDADDDNYAELVSRENGELNADYADQAYYIWGLSIPNDCPSGVYGLRLHIETQFGEQLSLNLGTIEVLALDCLMHTNNDAFVVSAGERIELDNWILCNSDEFESAELRLQSMDDFSRSVSGEELGADIIKLDASRFAQLMDSAEMEINKDHVDSAYSIASIEVPEDCPGGMYCLYLKIGDHINYLTDIEVRKMEAYAASDGRDVTGQAGEKVDIDAWVLCRSEDFNSMKRRLSLVDESGTAIECGSFTPEKLDASSYERCLASVSGELDADLANVGYALKDITIPLNCPDGTYRLVLEMETENHSGEDRYSWDLGGVTVTSVEQTEIEDYVDAEKGYAIGIDPLLQPSFRPDNIVLTGWVYHLEDSVAYFDHCELVDGYGRSGLFDSVFAGENELLRCDRGDIQAHAQGMTGGTTQNAGFVISIDVSDARVYSGETYTLKLYTSNVQGEAWETLDIPILIDENAPVVSQETIDSIVAGWLPSPSFAVPLADPTNP